jgi:hypothetical protein
MKTLDQLAFPLFLAVFTLAMLSLFVAFASYVEKFGL